MNNVSTEDWEHYLQKRKRELKREHLLAFKKFGGRQRARVPRLTPRSV